jgi:excisionase family DNA binding protein
LHQVPASTGAPHAPVVAPVSPDAELLGELQAAIVDDLAERLAARVEIQVKDGERAEGLPADHWLTVDEVARLVRTCRRTVYRALHAGELAGEKVGPLWRIRSTAVAAWAKPFRPRPNPAAARPAAAPTPGTRRKGGAPTRDVTSFKTRARAGRARRE